MKVLRTPMSGHLSQDDTFSKDSEIMFFTRLNTKIKVELIRREIHSNWFRGSHENVPVTTWENHRN